MASRLTTRLADTRGFLAKIWQLSRPYWFSEERWFARGSLAAIIGMNFFLVWMSTLLNNWNGDFFNALQEKNAGAFWHLLLSLDSISDFFYSFAGLVTIYIAVAVVRVWFRLYLTIRWRRWLTDVYYRDWLADRTYYRMELTHGGTDNPDQRIEQDVASFASQTLQIGLGLISEVVTLVTFVVILWRLSGSFVLPILGGITVPGYMVWVALLYSVLGSWLTFVIGRRLVRINFNLERYNADFRYRLVRVRENSESIALYGGEPDEVRRLRGAFGKIFNLWWDYMRVQIRLATLTTFYGQLAGIFPIVVQAPRYFAGEIPLGTLTRTAGAFAQVQGSLSWFVESFATLADWKATVDRLTTFADTMAEAKRAVTQDAGFEVSEGQKGELALDRARVDLPSGQTLLEHADLRIRQGEAVVLQGPSGSGKTTLFRVLAGLWPFGRGQLRFPGDTRVLFLPQKPYLPIGTLHEVLSYPNAPETYSLEECRAALDEVLLSHLAARLDEAENWSLALSPGEQQRVAFARAFLFRPDWLFMDEATSALDEATELHLYEELVARLPDATIVSIAHKPTVLRFHERRIVIDPVSRSVSSEPIAVEA